MNRRIRYQQGSVQREGRRNGPDVWVFRWWESTSDGGSKRRKAIVGTVLTLQTEAAALRAARALRIDANQQAPHAEGGPSTIAELVAHYRLKELAGENQGRKAFSTRAAYECYLKSWILPPLGELSLRSSQASRRRGMAGRHQAGKGHEGEDSKFDERGLSSRNAVRLA
jgi:hypothetical protein